jgi:peptidoglycan/xylan/chitin deacetylase (PgdA/CDA1 family)
VARGGRWAAALLMAVLTVSAGCSRGAETGTAGGTATPAQPAATPPVTEEQKPDPAPARPAWVTPVTDVNFEQVVAKYHPNEMGRVLILEYHDFKDEEERWARRRDNFRKDLEMLYAKGYRAVNLRDYLADSMALPAGTSPVIFTFDDGRESQLKLIQKDGQWAADPDSAVGIMLEFKQEHPDFGAAGTFYVNFTPVPFVEQENWKEKVKFLVANGFEIGNHTMYHDDQSTLSDDEVQQNLAEQVKLIQAVLPDYDGSTYALPFGIWPQNKDLAIRGEWEGVKYNHRAVLLVGADPVYALYDKRVDVMSLPRVQAIDDEFKRWMPYLDDHRYISDGDPDTVVIPESAKEFLNSEAVKGKMVRTYKSSS